MTDQDRMEFKKNFEESYGVIVTKFGMSIESNAEPIHVLGSFGVVDVVSIAMCTVTVTCYLTQEPPVPVYQWFDLRECGHALHIVKTTQEFGRYVFELTYRTSNYEGFVADVRDAVYRRYSTEFHKQLEDILD